jgi:hypothetical protein
MWGMNLTTERVGGKVTWRACTSLAYFVHHSSLFERFQICVESTLNVTCVMEWRISVLLQGWQYESGRKLLWVSDLVYVIHFRRGLLWALCSILLPLFSGTLKVEVPVSIETLVTCEITQNTICLSVLSSESSLVGNYYHVCIVTCQRPFFRLGRCVFG